MAKRAAAKTVSLSNELHLTMDVLRGALRLTQVWIDNHGIGVDDLPHGISAMLVVLVARLQLLDRAVRGVIDPRLAWCPENDARDVPGDPHEDDVRLFAWSDRALLHHLRSEWKRARRRLRWEHRRRPTLDERGP
jgi:hypothetical protein